MQLAPPFRFLDPGELREGDLRLVLKETVLPMASRPAAYRFEMRRLPDGARMGRIELRIGQTQDLILYTGHIGYRVDPQYRGHRYAARSCVLLADLARRHGHAEIWITCDPENLSSRRTCELTGAIFEGIVPLPEHHFFYKAGSRSKCRFRLPLLQA
jgi:tagatose 1,6-diphosphate aldolase